MRTAFIGSFLACGFVAPLSVSAASEAGDDALQAFRDTWAGMLDIDALSYIKVVESDVPGLVSGSVVQSGALTLSTNTGIGVLVLEPGKAADELLELPVPGHGEVTYEDVLDAVGGQQFQYRLIDNIFWQGIPRPEGLTWMGADIADLPFDVSAVFDGVALVDGAFTSDDLTIVARSAGEDGATDWTVSVDADLVGPLGAQTGTNQRLLDAGFDGETDGRTQVLVHADRAGVVTHVSADLSDWSVDAISEADSAAGDMLEDIDVRIDIRFAVPDKPLEVVAPCTDPTTEIQQGIETLLCPVEV